MQVEITNIIDETSNVKRFELTSMDDSIISFQSGQFIQIFHPELPEFANSRSYSISSINLNSNKLEICVALNKNGIFTPWLFSLEIGNRLEISVPQGSFILKNEHIEFPLLFICTGTGIAPFRSMIYKALENSIQPIYLVFGNRFEEDILYKKEWELLGEKYDQFNFIPVLSRESNALNKGYVHEYYTSILKELGEARIFVCGWKNMCLDARENLKLLGYNRRQYFFEQYD